MFKVTCGCTGNCKTARCSCKKAGLACTQLCKRCNEESCSNMVAEQNPKVHDTGEGQNDWEEDDTAIESEFMNIAAKLSELNDSGDDCDSSQDGYWSDVIAEPSETDLRFEMF